MHNYQISRTTVRYKEFWTQEMHLRSPMHQDYCIISHDFQTFTAYEIYLSELM